MTARWHSHKFLWGVSSEKLSHNSQHMLAIMTIRQKQPSGTSLYLTTNKLISKMMIPQSLIHQIIPMDFWSTQLHLNPNPSNQSCKSLTVAPEGGRNVSILDAANLQQKIALKWLMDYTLNLDELWLVGSRKSMESFFISALSIPNYFKLKNLLRQSPRRSMVRQQFIFII